VLKDDIAQRQPVEQTADMEISIIFDTAFQGDAAGAVWIVESPQNRQWFEQQAALDEWSAVFTPEGGAIGRAAILRSIWNVQERYPEWSRITVSGVALTDDLTADLVDEGAVIKTEQGFSLARS
jgi:hypothetical protein